MRQMGRDELQNIKTVKDTKEHVGKTIGNDQEGPKEQYKLDNSSNGQRLKVTMERMCTRDSADPVW